MKMYMKLTRLDCTDKGIFGHLICEDFECVTLERHDVAIPVGKYKVTLYNSPSNHTIVPLLHDVPGRSMIEIHIGNWETDSKGCILLGTTRDGFAIEHSGDAFHKLMSKLTNATDIEIEII